MTAESAIGDSAFECLHVARRFPFGDFGSSAKFVGEGRFYDEETFLRLSNAGNVFAVLRIQHRVPRIWRANEGWLRRRQKRRKNSGFIVLLKTKPKSC